ncbi:MAG: D-TA family PLP-dependent enzyme [Chitinophagaceae bacterium]
MNTNKNNWYIIENINSIDSPALVIYKKRMIENINLLKSMVKNVDALRPHVKTNKISEVCKIILDEGIKKFKCATIAEAEMLAQIEAPDVLFAYQPVGPKVLRLLALTQEYTSTNFSCLIDNIEAAKNISKVFSEKNTLINVFIDLNVGQNRTGIKPENALELFNAVQSIKNIKIIGLHVYDGHIRDSKLEERKLSADKAFGRVAELLQHIYSIENKQLKIVIGGSPTFPTHATRENVECSPGTFVFWDWNYKTNLPDEPFEFAALIIARIISIVDETTICLDLGHKSIAAENALPNRVHFLNAPNAKVISQSEEHLVVQVSDSSVYKIGDVFYGVPFHICPTVALYEKAFVIENSKVIDEWKVIARNRKINV